MEKWRLKRRFKLSWDFYGETVARFRNLGWPQTSALRMYEYYLPVVDTGPIHKVIVVFQPVDSASLRQSMNIDLIYAPCEIDLQTYALLNSKDRGIMLFQNMHETLLDIAEDRGWNAQAFQEAYSKVTSANFEFSGYWKTPLSNPSRQYKAQIYWEFDDEIEVFICIGPYKGDGPTSKISICRLPATLAALDNILGQLKWEDESHVRLLHTNKRDYWDINVPSGTVNFCYPRALNEDAHGQYDLGIMYLEGRLVPKDREKAIYWIRKTAEKKFGRAIKKLIQIE